MTPKTRLVAVLAPLLALAAGCASMPPSTPAIPSPAQAEAARTPEQHEALAMRFEQEARRLVAEAKQHRELGAAYQRGPQYQWINIVGLDASTPALLRHCEQLARNAEEAARTYSAMAQEHRRLALGPPSRSE